MPTLVLMRHGATILGEEKRFSGWADTPLSEIGLAAAERSAIALENAGFIFDLCLTSRLARAQQSLAIIQARLHLPDSVIRRDWRLNERHYGSLQGEMRTEMIERFGNAQVAEWRRSYDARPPSLDIEDPRWREQLVRLPDISAQHQPRGESLRDAVERVTPVWSELIAPALKAKKTVLVVAHTSSIRAIARSIEGLDDAESAAFRIATAIPRCYELDGDLGVVGRTDLSRGMGSHLRYWSNRLKPRWLGGL
jgi:2,3-bisphosphoglycerate-dependent phosphoglycerate mutase